MPDCFSTCLLTRFSEPSNSWPRNKNKMILFPSGFRRKLAQDQAQLQKLLEHTQAGVLRIQHNGANVNAKLCSTSAGPDEDKSSLPLEVWACLADLYRYTIGQNS